MASEYLSLITLSSLDGCQCLTHQTGIESSQNFINAKDNNVNRVIKYSSNKILNILHETLLTLLSLAFMTFWDDSSPVWCVKHWNLSSDDKVMRLKYSLAINVWVPSNFAFFLIYHEICKINSTRN